MAAQNIIENLANEIVGYLHPEDGGKMFLNKKIYRLFQNRLEYDLCQGCNEDMFIYMNKGHVCMSDTVHLIRCIGCNIEVEFCDSCYLKGICSAPIIHVHSLPFICYDCNQQSWI
jgi:hypothetical protein